MPDGSKFVALIQAQLDTSKINSQLLNASKKWGVNLKIKNFTLDTRGLQTQIQNALNGRSFTLKLTNVDVGSLSNTITGRVRGIGTQAGTAFSQAFYNRIAQSGELGKAISTVESKFNSLTSKINSLNDSSGLSDEAHNKYVQLQTDLERLRVLRDQFFSSTTSPAQKVAAYDEFNATLIRVRNNLSMVTNETRQFASAMEVATLQNRMEAWLTNNSRATKAYGSQIQSLVQRLRELSAQGNVEKAQLQQLAAEFNNVKASAQAAGLTGKSFGSSIAGAFKSITRYVGVATVVYRAISAIKNGISDIVALDTALVDLRKTTDATEAELKEFYYTANDVAKQLGVTTEEVISAAAEWSRLGYSIKDAETMAKTSSIFASISPGMDIEESTQGLVSTMKAFGIEADEALDGIASKINAVGNSQALSNKNIVEFLTRSSAAMKEANNTLDETIALGTAATEVTQDASSVGNALKTISMRVRGYDEETEEFIGNVEVLSGKIANLTKTANNPGGISLFTDETKTTYKSTYELLKDISAIYNDLTDKQQAGLLEALAGKRQGQVIAAILNNFGAVEKSLATMEDSAGNAQAEMSIIMDSMEYKINALKETAVGVFQNIFKTEDMGNIVSLLTGVLNVIDGLTSTFGLLGTAMIAVPIVAFIKNFGQLKALGLEGATDINLVTSATIKMSAADTAAVLAKTNLTDAEQIHILRLKGVSAEEAAAMVQTYSYAAAETTATTTTAGLTTATTGLKTALHGLKAAFMSNPIGFIVTAAVTAITLISSLSNSIKSAAEQTIESAQKARQNVADLQSEKSQIDSLINKYKELRESGKWDVSTRSEITEIQAELTRLVGQQADSLDLVNGKLDDELEKLKKISGDWDDSAIDSYSASLRENLKLLNNFAYKNDPYGSDRYRSGAAVRGQFNSDIASSDTSERGISLVKAFNEKWKDKGITLSYGSKGFILGWNEATVSNTLESMDDWIETLGNYDDFKTNKDLQDFQTEVIKLRDQFKEDVYNPILDSAQTLANGIIKDETDNNKKFLNYDSYLNYRDQIISKVTNDADIKSAIEQGILNQDSVEQMVDDYFSTLDTYSDYYEKWYNESASAVARKGKEFKELFANSLNPDDPKTSKKIEEFNNWFDSLSDDEKEIVFTIKERYNNDHVKSELETFSEGGTVDLTLRPKVDSSVMQEAGWDVEDGSISTVFTSTFSNEDETRFLNFTPIIADENGNFKGVLTPDELAEYAQGVINGTRTDDLKLQIGSEFDSADAAEEAAITIHEYQEWLFDKDDISTFGLEQWKDALADFEIPETDKFHFSDLISDKDFQNEVKDYKDNLTTLTDALDDYRNGELSAADEIELFEKFPKLASQTGDLDSALESLIDSFKTDAISAFDEELGYMKTDDDVAALNALKESILKIPESVTNATRSLSVLKEELEDLTDTYSDIKGVIDDYNENGYLTLDNLQSIMSLEPKYVNLLIDENGQINLNNAAYKEYVATKAKSLLVEQLKDLYSTVLNMKLEEAQAYANAVAYDAETRSVNDLLTATTQLYMVQAQSKDSANNTTAYTDAMKRSFSTAANYAAMVDSYINSLSTSQNEFSTATEDATSALEAQKEALEDEKDALEDAKDALEDYKDALSDAQSDIQDLIDLVIEYIKQLKNDEMDALSDQIDALETQKDNYADIIAQKKEALELAKKEREEAEKLSDLQKAVAKDALALAVANLDDSSAGKKAQKQARDNLLESNKNLQDELAEQEYDMRIAALEKDQEEYEAHIDKRIEKLNKEKDAIQEYLNNVRQLYEDACNMIDNDTGDLYGKLWNEYVYPYTTKTRAEFDNLWSKAQEAIQRYIGDNGTLIGVMEYLQGEIYITDGKIENLETEIGRLETAIDLTSGAIDKTSTSIGHVSSSINGLGQSISDYLDLLNQITNQKKHHFNWDGVEYISYEQDQSSALADISAQIKARTGKSVTVYGPLAYYKKGTYDSVGGVSVTQEDDKLESIFGKLRNGKYTLMNEGSHVFNAEATENLHKFMDNPTEFMSQHTRGYDYSGWLKSNYGNYDSAIKSISENVSNTTGDTSISAPVTITIQGDATQSTVNAIKKESDKIKDAIINDITRVREKQRRATIR